MGPPFCEILRGHCVMHNYWLVIFASVKLLDVGPFKALFWCDIGAIAHGLHDTQWLQIHKWLYTLTYAYTHSGELYANHPSYSISLQSRPHLLNGIHLKTTFVGSL